jgi:hypothetical protein
MSRRLSRNEFRESFCDELVGVVGPNCKHGNQNILTHDMVHRTHLDIFHYYYPPEFENWWADNWITNVYKPNRSTKSKTWAVHHKMIHGTQYFGCHAYS